MATRPIPTGTVNLSVNLPRAFRLDVGKLAHTEGKSIGQLVRELLAERIEDARQAGHLVARTASTALVLLGLGCLAWASCSPSSPIIARRLRYQRTSRVAAVSFANRIRCTRAAA